VNWLCRRWRSKQKGQAKSARENRSSNGKEKPSRLVFASCASFMIRSVALPAVKMTYTQSGESPSQGGYLERLYGVSFG
jgi:hypothetical protein